MKNPRWVTKTRDVLAFLFIPLFSVMALELNWQYQERKQCFKYSKQVEHTRDSIWLHYNPHSTNTK